MLLRQIVLLATADALRLSRARPAALLRLWRARPAPLPAAPGIFTELDDRPVVLFDGECNLCNAGVNLLLDLDRCSTDARGNLRVAALQSGVGRLLLARLPPRQLARARNEATGEYSSIVVAGGERAWVGAAAVLKIGRQLRGPLRILALLGTLVPRFLLDAAYGVLSRRRKAWFGDADQCRLWDDNWDLRFVDDAVVGLGGAGPVAGAPPAAVGDSVLVATPDPCFGADGSLLNGLQGTVVACRDDDACDTGTLDVVFEDGAAATTMRAVDAAVLRRAVPA